MSSDFNPSMSSAVPATAENPRVPDSPQRIPGKYTSSGTYSRVWSVLAKKAGSQPWSAVSMRASPSCRRGRNPPSHPSKREIAFAYPSRSRRCPYFSSKSTRLTKHSPEKSLFRHSSAFRMPSSLPSLTPRFSVMPRPAKMSEIFPIPMTSRPAPFRRSSMVSPVGGREKSCRREVR